MSNQPRVAKVLAALLISMTAGAIVLLAMGNNPPSAGPFCLSIYYRLDPVEKAIISRSCQSPSRWSCIEIYYSGTKAGNVEQLASLNGKTAHPTDFQIKRTETLAEKLCRKFSIQPESIYYPSDWQ